ncbi:MAG: integrase [Desulfovibrionales bacterium GWA2_65_9]|nr:MAG: integrase [Desulfovibrionales bacterium GWA2_65_9]
MPLTDIAVRNIKPDNSKTLRIKDDRGLYLEVSPAGGKWWRLRYWIAGKENRLSLGVYPDVSLKDARERRDEARRLIANGIDPSQVRKGQHAESLADLETFKLIAEEWFEKFRHKWTDNTAETVISRLRKDIFPYIGTRAIREITAPELLAVIRRIESRGAVETARRDLQKCGEVFRYALATGRAEHDIAADLRGAIAPPKKRHFASIHEPKEVGELLRAIEGYSGSFVTRSALKLAPLTFVRPGELRHAEWTEVNLDNAEWRIPAARMKMREKHIVPLSRQAVEVLRELRPLTGTGHYVFPGERSYARPMSENTVLGALRRLGYEKGEMTGHGFRSMASTILHEQGWASDVVERQLAHGDRNKIRASYNFAQHLPERRRMMQAWADYLDGLKDGGKVVPIIQGAQKE